MNAQMSALSGLRDHISEKLTAPDVKAMLTALVPPPHSSLLTLHCVLFLLFAPFPCTPSFHLSVRPATTTTTDTPLRGQCIKLLLKPNPNPTPTDHWPHNPISILSKSPADVSHTKREDFEELRACVAEVRADVARRASTKYVDDSLRRKLDKSDALLRSSPGTYIPTHTRSLPHTHALVHKKERLTHSHTHTHEQP
jgi:hypothetical protein